MKMPPNYGTKYTDDFLPTFQELANEQEVPLIPFLLEGGWRGTEHEPTGRNSS